MIRGIKTWLQKKLCRHQWKRSMFVNIQTGENLGCLCRKCGAWKP